MSSIKIVCRKGVNKKIKGNESDATVGDALEIESKQLFMNTKEFFDKVKDSLKEYFEVIEKN